MKILTPTYWSRRRVLCTVFCSSAMLGLNVNRASGAGRDAAAGERHWLAIGDFGSQEQPQVAVAHGMMAYQQTLSAKPEALLLLGDNFYKRTENWSVTSPRWKTGIEDMYPQEAFACPMPAVLGNHDYHDNPGGEQVQLDYAKKEGTRWHLPAKWYRMDAGGTTPLVTFLFLDTNLRSISGGRLGVVRLLNSLTKEEEQAQLEWFKAELAKPRAPWTIVVGHHPVFSNGSHGDSKELVERYAPLMQ
ncbi:MAG: metallophosphoesterase, partial [Roseimicrobium sp.]